MKKLFLLLILLAGMSQAQTTVAPFISPAQQFFDNSGLPLNGGKVCTFAAGTTTPLATYSDNGVTTNANPVILDSAGRATIYLQNASYKIVIAASTANSSCVPAIKTQDNVSWANIGSTVTSLTANGTVQIIPSTAATSGANQTGPNTQFCGNYWTGAASAADCWTLADILGTGSNPTSTLTLTHSGSSGASTFSAPQFTGGSTSNPNVFNVSTFTSLTSAYAVQVTGTNSISTSGLVTTPTLTVSTSETVTQPTIKTGANQLNQSVGVPIESFDDWSRQAIFGTGIIPGKWSSISSNFPLGNDNPIMGTGPSDIPIRHIDLNAQCQGTITSGSEQNCILQIPAPIAGTFSATGNASGGTLAGGTNYFIKATWTACTAYTYLPSGLQNPTCTLGGETTASPELQVTTPTCSVANTCSITVTFVGVYPSPVPDIYPGIGAYSLYSSSTTGNEKLMIANHDVHTSYTMTAVGGGASPPVSNTALFPTSELSSASRNGIVLERGCDTGNNCAATNKTEFLTAGTLNSLSSGQWAVNGANAIHIFAAKNHAVAPFDVSQVGSTILHGDNFFLMSDRPLGAGGVSHNAPIIIYDSTNTEAARWPTDIGTGNIYPDWMWEFNSPITGKNGATSDVVVRSYKSGSFFRVQSFNAGGATGVDLFTVNDNGAVIVPAGNFTVSAGQIFGSWNSGSASAATAGTQRMASTDLGDTWNNNAGTANLSIAKNTNDILTWAGIPTYAFVTGDQTITAGSLTAIPGLSWTMPANAALKAPFSCHLLYSQATAAASDSFGIQDVTVAPTSLMAKGQVYTSATALTAGNLPALTTTTATAIVTFTPSAATTVWNADLDGFIEQPSNASTSVVQIMAQFTTNNGTIKRGSFCRVF